MHIQGLHRRAAILAVGAALGVVVLTPASAWAGAWIGVPASAPISEGTVSASEPTVATSPSGAEVAAWVVGASVLATVRTPGGGAFGTPVTLNSTSGSNTVYGAPSVAIGPGGETLVAWVQHDGTNYSVQFASAAPGQTLTPGVSLPGSSGTTAEISPHAAFFADGTALLAWAPTGGQVLYVLRPQGGSFGAFSSIGSSGSVTELAVAGDSANRALLVWDEATTATSGSTVTETSLVRATDLTDDGSLSAIQTIDTDVSSYEAMTCFICANSSLGGLHAAEDAAGDAVIAYQELKPDFFLGVTTEVKASYRPAGSGFDSMPAMLASIFTLFGTIRQDVTVLSDGTALVAWDDGYLEPYGGTGSVFYVERNRSASSFPAMPQTLVTGSTENDYSFPAVAVAAGGALIAYVHNKEVVAQTLSGEGTQGPAVALSKGEAPVTAPRLAGDGQGDGAAVWTREDASKYLPVEAASYDEGPRLAGLSVPATALTGASLGFGVTATDPFSPITSIAWRFGDGASASGADVAHAYPTVGAQTASASATDAAGLSSAALSGTTQVTAPAVAISAPLPGSPASPFTDTLKIAPQRLRAVLAKGLAATVSCSKVCTLKLVLELSPTVAKSLHLTARAANRGHKTARPVVIGSLTVTLAAAAGKVVHVKLTSTAKRALRHTRHLTLSVVASANGPGAPKPIVEKVALH